MGDRKMLEEFMNLSFLYGKISFTKTQLYEYQKAVANLLKENENLKQASIINDRLYQEVCNKNKELEKNCKKCVVRDRLNEYVENTIPKSLIKEKIEEIKEKDKKYKTYTKDGRENFITEYLAIPILQELLGEEK